MHECTHPHFNEYEIANVYAALSDMACVKGASNAGMRDMGKKRTSGAFSALLHELCNHSSPTGLVARSGPFAIVSLKVLTELD